MYLVLKDQRKLDKKEGKNTPGRGKHVKAQRTNTAQLSSELKVVPADFAGRRVQISKRRGNQ